MNKEYRRITDFKLWAVLLFILIHDIGETDSHKMRSAQAPCGTWAIMKKFIYVCNVKHYMFA